MTPLLLPELFTDALASCGEIGLQWLEHPFVAIKEEGHRIKRKVTRLPLNHLNASIQLHVVRAVRVMMKAIEEHSQSLASATIVLAHRSIMISQFANRKFIEPSLVSPFMFAGSLVDDGAAYLLYSPDHADDVLAWSPTATGDIFSDAAFTESFLEGMRNPINFENESDWGWE